ncbi:hypothetical protein VD0002_g7277 [Verticillium dahliae]|uniref:Uncharacterized protein n=2 Tax=Verticillium dahliae TaxID=27337 RepID=G2XIK7_VERDV|nr:uncharacterized protein VDAG_09989 [Verticillium dahliae VdLs.17]KAF3348074.1 hypothetical protein VdG2_03800 [Verticillium dahliae VDG2]KAH6707999.1 hypothetical protein EV126DRAFT_407788 [Verticillium dahliae]EGY20360.1 hypothetical protein VDAG_09989 [Verticillium dahliae VdLs.17]PNH30504.1 hypothetical protein BJF96_g6222 [Verticillium dahliae]PNH48869.1 hypothetical protein VD0003_g8265 [Verticillium dahliae]
MTADKGIQQSPPTAIPTITLTTPESAQMACPVLASNREKTTLKRRPSLSASQQEGFLCVPSRGTTRRDRLQTDLCDECTPYRCRKHQQHTSSGPELDAAKTRTEAKTMTENQTKDDAECRRVVAGAARAGSGPAWLRMGARVARRGLEGRRIRINGLWYYENVARAA